MQFEIKSHAHRSRNKIDSTCGVVATTDKPVPTYIGTSYYARGVAVEDRRLVSREPATAIGHLCSTRAALKGRKRINAKRL
jgi:hypothetical protein